MRLLEHTVFVIGQLDSKITSNDPKFLKHQFRIDRIKDKLHSELQIYDNMEKSYKQFTVLRLVAILKCMNIKPNYLGDFYRNIKMKMPNIYVETLSRTMLKVHNYQEVIHVDYLLFRHLNSSFKEKYQSRKFK